VLNVLMDATAVPSDRRGVGRYVDSLVPHLADNRDAVRLQVVCRSEDVAYYTELSETPAVDAGTMTKSRPGRLLWEQTFLGALAHRHGADVLHCPHYTMPVTTNLPTVVTLHDATFFSDPGFHTRSKRVLFTAAIRHAIRRADELVVPSAATRAELVRLVSPRAGRAVVAPHAVDPHVFHPPSAAEVTALRTRLGLTADRPYVSFLGTIEPRKNIPNLIRACAQAFRPGGETAPALVVAGGAGWDDTVDAVAREAQAAGLHLIRPGYLPLASLRALLGGAAVVAYPSMGEGFGLPVLEAMACGAPVLTTRRLALPEVGGDAVAYTEPDAGSIAASLSDLLANPGRRAELTAAGLHRAADFSWAATAAIHLDTYRRAASRARLRTATQ
jgi:glycosyltransferase involved in cell wall biosynthesis